MKASSANLDLCWSLQLLYYFSSQGHWWRPSRNHALNPSSYSAQLSHTQVHAHPILPATCACLVLLLSTCLCSHPQVSTEAQLVAALDHTQTDAADKLCFIECIIHRDDCSRELLEWGGEFRVGFSCLRLGGECIS